LLFVTKFNGYQVLAQRDLTRRVPSNEGDDNGWASVVVRPQVMIEFCRNGFLTYHQRQTALAFFDAQDASGDGMPPGPYRNPGLASDPDFEGNVYAASDHWLFFSTFDTEKDCPFVEGMDPDDVRELCESTLLRLAQLGNDYILIEDAPVAPPWPTYEKTHHNKKVAICEELGLDPVVCAEYEKQRESPQESVIAGFYALAEKQKEAAAAMEQLTVRG
jgi:hypothetical protein